MRIAIGMDDIGIGGAFTMSCVIREVKKVAPDITVEVHSYHPELYENNPYADTNKYFTDGPCRKLSTPPMDEMDPNRHYNHYYCEDLGIKCTDIHPEIYMTNDELMLLRGMYDLPKKFIILHAQPCNIHHKHGKDDRWTDSKDWYPDRWEEVVRAAPLPVYQVRLEEEPYIHGCIDTVGTTVREACGLIALSELTMCCISYSMHAASAANRKALVICGGRENPLQTCYPSRHLIINSPVECSPCWIVGKCTMGKKCMDKIRPEHVITNMNRLLDDRYIGNATGIYIVR